MSAEYKYAKTKKGAAASLDMFAPFLPVMAVLMTFFTLLSCAAVLPASSGDRIAAMTNAERFARNLPPKAPKVRFSGEL